MQGGRKDDDAEVNRLIGRHGAQLEHHEDDITDLRNQMERAERQMRQAMKEWKTAADKYRHETNKNIWIRRGFLAALVFMFAVYAWFIHEDKPLAEELFKWLTHASQKSF